MDHKFKVCTLPPSIRNSGNRTGRKRMDAVLQGETADRIKRTIPSGSYPVAEGRKESLALTIPDEENS